MPLRSLNRSSPCGALTLEVSLAGAALATDVSEDDSPHNLWIAGETGWDRSPAWNNERKLVSPAVEPSAADDADATVTGLVDVAPGVAFGKLER